MNCNGFDQLVALYVEEDLSGSERARVEAHLKECSSCWDLAEDLRQSQSLFKMIREDVPDETALAALRDRVLGQVSGLESMTWFERVIYGGFRRKVALASVALLMIGSGALWLVREPDVAPKAPAIVVVPPSIPEPPPEPLPPQEPKPVRLPEAVPPPVLAAEIEEPRQVAIKFLTDDPNIIIYWLVDEKGD